MQTLSVNSVNDIFTVGGNLVIANDLNALRQACTQVSMTLKAEFQFDKTRGIDYDNTIWNQRDMDSFYTSLTTEILNLPEVLSIGDFSVMQEADNLSYSLTIYTIYGEAAINGTIL